MKHRITARANSGRNYRRAKLYKNALNSTSIRIRQFEFRVASARVRFADIPGGSSSVQVQFGGKDVQNLCRIVHIISNRQREFQDMWHEAMGLAGLAFSYSGISFDLCFFGAPPFSNFDLHLQDVPMLKVFSSSSFFLKVPLSLHKCSQHIIKAVGSTMSTMKLWAT